MKRSLLTLLCAMTAFGAQAADTHKAAPKGDAARGQAIVATVCVACHGPDGNSPLAANPKLAGQHSEYLLKQMQNFKAVDGKQPERVSPIMNGMIAAYDEGQMRDLAAYFATQTQKGEAAKSRETIELGRKLYRGGDQSKGLPACAACHGPAGAGIPAQYPRIGGQFAEYTEVQLKSFREGTRANDPNKMMRMVAIKMTDAEIKAVADYIAGLH
jgi:cytochrome c553